MRIRVCGDDTFINFKGRKIRNFKDSRGTSIEILDRTFKESLQKILILNPNYGLTTLISDNNSEFTFTQMGDW